MTDLEIIAAMEADLNALNNDIDVLMDSVLDLENELDSMEKDYK